MTKQTGFRVLGSALDRAEPYLDLEVDGVDSDGNIYLHSQKIGESWSFSTDKLRQLKEDHKALGIEDANAIDDQLWKILNKLGENVSTVDVNNFSAAKLEEAEAAVFEAIIEEAR